MTTYIVSYPCVYTDVVKTDSPKRAAEMVAFNLPCKANGMAHVTREDTWEEWDVGGDGKLYNYHNPEGT